MRKLILAILITLMAASFAAADTLYLRDGRTVRGTVLGFTNGRFAVKLTAALSASTVSTQTGAQTNSAARLSGDIGDIVFIRTRDIERVEIEGRSLDEARFVTRSVQVELGPNWVDTGIDLRRGERVQVNASGTIIAGRTRITPGGLRTTDPNAPLPRAAEGVLIGAIGSDPNSPIIEIGLNREFVADRDGRLYLTSNRSSYTDARGAFTAQIRREISFGQRTAGNRRNDDYDNDDSDDLFGGSTTTSEPAAVRPRILTGEAGQPTSTTTQPTAREVSVTVPGNSRGTDTGLDLRAGDSVTVTATGTIIAGRRAGEVSADGGRASIGGALLGTRPVPSAGVGTLLGYIRLTNGQITQPFVLGSQQTFSAPSDGRLFLLVNDDNYSDNSGSFNVRIVRTSTAGAQSGGTSGQAGERVVTVYADAREVDTGIDVRAGDRLTFSATGNVYSRNTGAISAEGNRRYDSSVTPLPDAPFGALLGYIRLPNGQALRPFFIGSQQTIRADESGRLFLLVNDDDNRDNSGSFRVRILY